MRFTFTQPVFVMNNKALQSRNPACVANCHVLTYVFRVTMHRLITMAVSAIMLWTTIVTGSEAFAMTADCHDGHCHEVVADDAGNPDINAHGDVAGDASCCDQISCHAFALPKLDTAVLANVTAFAFVGFVEHRHDLDRPDMIDRPPSA